jgi:hypothetical protein
LNDFDANPSYTRLHHVEPARGGSANINDPAPDEWTSIGNPDYDTLIIAQVDNPYKRAKGQGAMRGCHFFWIIVLSARGLSTVEIAAVPGRKTSLNQRGLFAGGIPLRR